MPVDRMSPLDATFLHVEDSVTHMHIASTTVFEGPAPAYEELLSMIEGKLQLVEKYRKVVRFVPLHLGRPVWVDDPYFRLEYHVRHTALPSPGGPDELRRLIGRVMSQPLDRDRPLWEVWMVENYGDDQWAMMSKVHHCMVDGVSGTELLSIILDAEPDPPRPEPAPWHPSGAPTPLELAVEAVGAMAVSPFEQMRAVRAA
ncbi:MAG TPA: wax ester/triacylglycerol synthase domain-containing protein, partial [Acidimicrobiales bacterium]|nr:wax ester/triacylglycerol synthase domain-containing protein [Acidimicrobiales bacterium]